MKKNKKLETGTSIFQDDEGDALGQDDDDNEEEEEENKMNTDKNSETKNSESKFMPLTLESNQSGEEKMEVKNNTNNSVIDIEKEVIAGNFDPILLVLKNNLIDKNFIDSSGFGLLHQAASHDNHAMAKFLIEEKGVNVDHTSLNLQTSLMVATNYGRIPLIKYFVDRKADLNARDNTHFTPLLYSVKQNEIAAFIYLLFVGADSDPRDKAGCGLVHWAAYKNNLWLLKLLRALGFSMEERDASSMTALERAIDNNAFECVAYLLDIYPLDIVKALDIAKIESKSIKNLVNKRLRPKADIISLAQGQKVAFLIYLLLGVALFLETKGPVSEILNDFLFICFAFYSLLIYFFFYASWFILKVSSASSHPLQQPTLSIDAIKNLSFGLDFSHLDKLLKNTNTQRLISVNETVGSQEELSSLNNSSFIGDSLSETISKFTFLHQVAALVEKNRYLEVYEFDFDRCCPTCIKAQSEKTSHCDLCEVCIPGFYFHSKFFSKCISAKNHIYYFCLLFFQQIILLIYLFIKVASLSTLLKGPNIFFAFEIMYRTWLDYSKISAITFTLFMVLLFYNSLFFFLNLLLIGQYLTYEEFFNRHKFRYLYSSKLFKDDRILNYYKHKKEAGFIINTLFYFRKAFSRSA